VKYKSTKKKLGDYINRNNFYSVNQDLTKSFQNEMSINKHRRFKYRQGNVMLFDGETWTSVWCLDLALWQSPPTNDVHPVW